MRLFVFSFFLFGISCGVSKTRNESYVQNSLASEKVIGVYNIDSVFMNMPEYKIIIDTLETFKSKLDMKDALMTRTYWSLQDHFYQDSASWTPLMKQVKQKEIDDLYKRIDEYRNTAWEDLHTMKNLLMTPIYEKVNNTISKLGKSKGFLSVINSDEEMNCISWTADKIKVVNVTNEIVFSTNYKIRDSKK